VQRGIKLGSQIDTQIRIVPPSRPGFDIAIVILNRTASARKLVFEIVLSDNLIPTIISGAYSLTFDDATV